VFDWQSSGSRGAKMQKGALILRDSWLIAALNCASALCSCLAQPSLLGICLAAAWQAVPLATKRRLRVMFNPGFIRLYFRASLTKSDSVKW
jgi:hypothetical protein